MLFEPLLLSELLPLELPDVLLSEPPVFPVELSELPLVPLPLVAPEPCEPLVPCELPLLPGLVWSVPP